MAARFYGQMDRFNIVWLYDGTVIAEIIARHNH